MLQLFASLLLVSATIAHPHDDRSSENWLQGLLKRSKRKAEFDPVLVVRSPTPSLLTVAPGSTQFIECEAGGYPSPAIHWLKDRQRITESELSYSSTETPLGLSIMKSRLYLDDVTPDQAGTYTCVAENSHSSRKWETKVDVIEEDFHDVSTMKSQNGKAPKIKVWTSNTLENQQTDVRLYCRSEGTPSPTVIWFSPDGEEITNSKKYKIEDNGDLSIKNLSWEDMGDYVCRSQNTEGTDRAHAFLYPLAPE